MPEPDATEPSAIVMERVRWEAELRFRERELALKEAEQRMREEEQKRNKESQTSQWRSPLVIAVTAAAIAALGNAVVTMVNGSYQHQIEAEKAEAGRILVALQSGAPGQTKLNLEFLAEVGLISNREVHEKLTFYLRDHPESGVGPAITANQTPSTDQSAFPPSRDPPGFPGSRPPATPADREFEISQRLQSLVDKKEYDLATSLFGELRQSHFTGVGYSAYPDAAFAFDQQGEEAKALQVLDFLEQRMNADEGKIYGYLARRGPQRTLLRHDLELRSPGVHSVAVRQRMRAIIEKL